MHTSTAHLNSTVSTTRTTTAGMTTPTGEVAIATAENVVSTKDTNTITVVTNRTNYRADDASSELTPSASLEITDQTTTTFMTKTTTTTTTNTTIYKYPSQNSGSFEAEKADETGSIFYTVRGVPPVVLIAALLFALGFVFKNWKKNKVDCEGLAERLTTDDEICVSRPPRHHMWPDFDRSD